jgi:hypothetical protein
MCGCEEDDKRKAEAAKNREKETDGDRADDSSRSSRTPLEFENMGLTRGG